MTTEQKRNGFEDDDLRDVIAEMEAMDDEAAEIMASAMGKVAGIRKKQKALKKRAKDDLSIPSRLLTTLLKQRKLERKLQELADDVPEDEIELYADAAGQFSFLAPEGDEPATVTPAQRAARKAAEAAKAHHEAEQAEGEAVLNELAAVH
jgi:hypothetical protein